LNMKFLLHRVNHIKSKSNNIYGETKAKDKRFLDAVVLYGLISIKQGENKNLNGNGIRREDVGEIIITILKKELNKTDIIISAGDYISYYVDSNKLRYFEITNPNYVDYSTTQSRGAIESVYKKITAIPAREDVVMKFNE